jgi:hypothetical protein
VGTLREQAVDLTAQADDVAFKFDPKSAEGLFAFALFSFPMRACVAGHDSFPPQPPTNSLPVVIGNQGVEEMSCFMQHPHRPDRFGSEAKPKFGKQKVGQGEAPSGDFP